LQKVLESDNKIAFYYQPTVNLKLLKSSQRKAWGSGSNLFMGFCTLISLSIWLKIQGWLYPLDSKCLSLQAMEVKEWED